MYKKTIVLLYNYYYSKEKKRRNDYEPITHITTNHNDRRLNYEFLVTHHRAKKAAL